MWPLSIVSPAMRAIGHATPQAWAVDAWTNLLSSHGTVTTIGRQLGMLALFALGFFAIAPVTCEGRVGLARAGWLLVWAAVALAIVLIVVGLAMASGMHVMHGMHGMR